MKYYSLTQLVDTILTFDPEADTIQLIVTTKNPKTNQFGQLQIQPAIIRSMKNKLCLSKHTYTQWSDVVLGGEDWSLSLKFPAKVLSEEWLVIIMDTNKKVCDTFAGHYYSRIFRKLDDQSIPAADKALKEIKTISEVQLDDEPIYID
jgi:hypothetical protein